MRICKAIDIEKELITFFSNKSLIPIVGSGLSGGVEASNGNVPTGTLYKEHMLKELISTEKFNDREQRDLKVSNFSSLSGFYEDDNLVDADVRFRYLKDNFYRSQFQDSDVRCRFLEIDWPYIYSLNIDDAIENSSKYSTTILPNREFRDEIFTQEKCLIKLHGDISDIVRYKESAKVFTSKEYALSLERNAPLLNKLRNDYGFQNILYVGCSLDDEIDLKTLTDIPVDYEKKDNLSKTIMFVKGYPGLMQQSTFGQYGITDVVWFDEYEEMYRFLYDTWKKSLQVSVEKIQDYKGLNITKIVQTEKELNQEYFLWGKGLLNLKKKTIEYPFYFISRGVAQAVVKNLNKHKIHLIQGGHVSGKSYLLADLYRTIRDREVYYFDGKSRLTNDALMDLLKIENSVVLFDVGAIDREQLELILTELLKIKKNKNNFIIAVNRNDSDVLGLVKWKMKQGKLADDDVLHYSLENRMSDDGVVKEVSEINQLLPYVSLPLYSNRRTMLDQLLYTENQLSINGKYSRTHIKVENYKQLALLIILAIKEKMYSADLINFSLVIEMADAIKRYNPFIEKTETLSFEKDAKDMSGVKYILNSKYWLQRELGNYAKNSSNVKMVVEAYQYIIGKVLEAAGSNEIKQRKLCKTYILFDVMNDIFLNRNKGNINLIVQIYTGLHELLAWDFNFLHQKAKCYLNFAHFITESKEKYLNDARQLAAVAESMAEARYEESGNERLLIALCHIQYTKATVLSEMCRLKNYTDIATIEKTIDAIQEALSSNYNADEYKKDARKGPAYGISCFINSSIIIAALPISDIHKNRFNEIISNYMIVGM